MSGHQLRPSRLSLPGPWFSSVLSRVAHSSEMLTQDIDGPQAEQLEVSPMDRHSKMNHIFLILEIKETFPIYMHRKAPWKWGVMSNGEWWHPTWASQVGLVRKNPSANAGNMSCGFNPWVEKIPWRRAWQHTPVFLPGESHGQRSLSGCGP